MGKMKNVRLMKIALKCIEKGYDSETLRYAVPEEIDLCLEYYDECRTIGALAFSEKITIQENRG